MAGTQSLAELDVGDLRRMGSLVRVVTKASRLGSKDRVESTLLTKPVACVRLDAGAGCVNYARPDLCGGRRVTGGPTAIESEFSYKLSGAFPTDEGWLSVDAPPHDLRPLNPDPSRFRWNLSLCVALCAAGVPLR
jgi:hypothetical protein